MIMAWMSDQMKAVAYEALLDDVAQLRDDLGRQRREDASLADKFDYWRGSNSGKLYAQGELNRILDGRR